MNFLKILLDDLVKSLPLFLFLASSTLYGYLLIHGHLQNLEKALKHAEMYYTWGIYGLIILGISIPINVIYKYYNMKKNDTEEVNIQSNNINSKSFFVSKFTLCQLSIVIWVIYTLIWVMETPYSNDYIYIVLTLLGLYCLRKERKKMEDKV